MAAKDVLQCGVAKDIVQSMSGYKLNNLLYTHELGIHEFNSFLAWFLEVEGHVDTTTVFKVCHGPCSERLREAHTLGHSMAVGPAFLRCESASPPAGTRSRKTHVAHRRIKIERVYRNYLTAWEAIARGVSVLRNVGSVGEEWVQDITICKN
jgi:hypothetical protein